MYETVVIAFTVGKALFYPSMIILIDFIFLLYIVLVTFILKYLYFTGGKCNSKKQLDGRIIIITGANTGIGRETAVDLARRGEFTLPKTISINKGIELLWKSKFKGQESY
jgi:hypothetical protein